MAEVSFRGTGLVDSLQHLKPSDICLIDMFLEIGDFSIPHFFKFFEEFFCKGDNALFVRLTDVSRN